MNARYRAKIWPMRQRGGIGPDEITRFFETSKLCAAIEQTKRTILRQGLLNQSFILFLLQRASRVDDSSPDADLLHRRLQNGGLSHLQIFEIFWLQSPLDFRIASERAGTGAGNVGEDAVEW